MKNEYSIDHPQQYLWYTTLFNLQIEKMKNANDTQTVLQAKKAEDQTTNHSTDHSCWVHSHSSVPNDHSRSLQTTVRHEEHAHYTPHLLWQHFALVGEGRRCFEWHFRTTTRGTARHWSYDAQGYVKGMSRVC